MNHTHEEWDAARCPHGYLLHPGGCPDRRPNLSHQNGSAGTITLPAGKSVPEPGIHPQEQPLQEGWQPPAPRTELIWAAIDLDGCLAEGTWTPESNGRDIGKPIERNVRKLEKLRWNGYKIVIHTARGWEHYEAIESWLNYWGIRFDRIVCGKLLAAVYVDDRAVESEQHDWTPEAQNRRQAYAYHVRKK